MQNLPKDILIYAQYTISIFILIQLWSSYETKLAIQQQYQTIDTEAVNIKEGSDAIQEMNTLYSSFRERTKSIQKSAEPFLELIEDINDRDLSRYAQDLEFAVLNIIDPTYDIKLPIEDKQLLKQLSKYPKLAHYTKERFYQIALLQITSMSSRSGSGNCFGGPLFSPIIKEKNKEIHIYPNYVAESHYNRKILINGCETAEFIHTWTPEEPRAYLFDVAYTYITENYKKETIEERLTLIAE